MSAEPQAKEPERIGPYAIHDEIGCGGMATVHLGQLRSASGFTRIVAIKRMHAQLARSPEFVAMFLDEARLASRIQHPNVVAALDWIATDTAAFLIMEYVHGVSLDQALRWTNEAGKRVPLAVASALLIGILLGLHAAHEAVDESGRNLGIVHRDISPHNILVGIDGLARVLDFGIAKAAERVQRTMTGEVKGKLGYIAPEQLFHDRVGREADIYSVGVMLWEIVVGRRLFANESQGQMLLRIANNHLDSPRTVLHDVSVDVEMVTMKALAPLPDSRYRTALEFATALEACIPPASQRVAGEWVASVSTEALTRRSELKMRIEGAPSAPMPSRAISDTGVRNSYGQRATTASDLAATPAVDIGASVTARQKRHHGVAVGTLAVGAAAIFAATVTLSQRPARRDAPLSPSLVGAIPAKPSLPVAAPSSGATLAGEAQAETAADAATTVGAEARSLHNGSSARPSEPPANQLDPSHFEPFSVRPTKPRPFGPPAPISSIAPHTSELDSIGGRE